MENELKELIEANSEGNRKKWAQEWKRRGKKVIGTLCPYVPEEIIWAAGMLPWRVSGTWRENVPRALAYRPANSCPYCNHVLESVLAGELNFLDGVVASSRDQDLVRLLDVWVNLGKTPLTVYMHLPHQDSELACQQFSKEMRKLIGVLENYGETQVTDKALREAVDTLNRTRRLLGKIYELRKRETPSLSGAEVLGLTTAATVMPRDEFNDKLERLLPYLEERRAPIRKFYPRVLVSSDMLDNPAYIQLIEDVGCIVAMDDLDTGSRYFWQTVDTSLGDVVSALAKRYLSHPASPHIYSWPKQTSQVIQWVNDFRINVVIELVPIYCQSRQIRVPFFRDRLNEAGIPNMSLTREYHLGNVAQLQTRVQALLETLGSSRD